jgi:hypothetical protein
MVSPIGMEAFFSRWGLGVMKSEVLWVWLLSFLMFFVSRVIRVVVVKE